MLALTDLDNVRSQAVAARLGMRDEGTTDRWFGLTARQFRNTLTIVDGRGRRGQVSSCRRSRQNSLPSGSASTCHPSSPR